jgi:hypothetical protein
LDAVAVLDKWDEMPHANRGDCLTQKGAQKPLHFWRGSPYLNPLLDYLSFSGMGNPQVNFVQ